MRIFVHDYSGHPFQVQLSRALAERGHEVVHAFCDSNPTTPKGALVDRPDDVAGFRLQPVKLPRPIRKGAFVDRWHLERLYGRKLAKELRGMGPEAVIMANTPLDSFLAVFHDAERFGIPVIYWLQDLIGEATGRILGAKLGMAGRLVGRYYRGLEKRLVRSSAAVVGITENFSAIVEAMGVDPDCYTTIPNWAPLDEVVPRPRNNPWACARGLENRFVFLYSGTLGFKHNPGLLLALAVAFREESAVRVVVNSQGDAADWLRQKAVEEDLENIQVNQFQPYEAMSDVLGTADVLVSILEPDASVFSVPSKVLSYHCAGRPLLLAIPENNLAARIVLNEESGLVVDPRDEEALVAAAKRLYDNSITRDAMGRRARGYAERNFDIERIADRFETVIRGAYQRRYGSGG